MIVIVHKGRKKDREIHSVSPNPRWKYYLGNTVQFKGKPHKVVAVGRDGFFPSVHLTYMP